ncbi:hypothetical protein QR680_019336 [Steinernema hermaphroditum]|uniref:Uncharacterized protein n=1 Tax=Steinernema hermaphroditum TaxID=289476 RepID=A0AA39GQU0_9BILA|nr:hypothetical protein QR680_019336 [Steinernema hermaphroditum]
MSNSLREACGEEAKDILVALVCAFPAIYSYRCHNRSKYELTTRELKEAFEFVVGSMRQEYGSKVTTELCWASWCSIRYNYVQLTVMPGLARSVDKNAIEVLVELIKDYPVLHTRECYIKDKHHNLPLEARLAFQDVVEHMKELCGPEATETVCWTSWRGVVRNNIRSFKATGRLLAKWQEKLGFLEPFTSVPPRDHSPPIFDEIDGDRPLVEVFGDKCVEALIKKVAKFPAFHRRWYVVRTRYVEGMCDRLREHWDEIVKELNTEFPGVQSKMAWRCWRTIRMTAARTVKWKPLLGFLAPHMKKSCPDANSHKNNSNNSNAQRGAEIATASPVTTINSSPEAAQEISPSLLSSLPRPEPIMGHAAGFNAGPVSASNEFQQIEGSSDWPYLSIASPPSFWIPTIYGPNHSGQNADPHNVHPSTYIYGPFQTEHNTYPHM